MYCGRCGVRCRQRRRRCRLEAHSHVLHASPDTRAREGIPLQPLSDAPPSRRARRPAPSHRATDQDLVPEPPHEVEARLQDGTAQGAVGRSRSTRLHQQSCCVVACGGGALPCDYRPTAISHCQSRSVPYASRSPAPSAAAASYTALLDSRLQLTHNALYELDIDIVQFVYRVRQKVIR